MPKGQRKERTTQVDSIDRKRQKVTTTGWNKRRSELTGNNKTGTCDTSEKDKEETIDPQNNVRSPRVISIRKYSNDGATIRKRRESIIDIKK